jgi:muramoyltetrapeptide carboxypeptidase
MSPGALARTGYLAGDDARRARELSAALLDAEVRAVVAARGGYGAMRILDQVPWAELARRPKWLVGFSDVTALHTMALSAGIASVHGPNVTGLGATASPAVRGAWLHCLERPSAGVAWRGLRVLRAGEARGPIVGGNLAILHSLAAAGRLWVPHGAVLALEDVGEAPYRVDRMLTSLALGGHCARAAALVFGSFERCPPGPDGTTVDRVLEACARALDVPAVAGAPFGHDEGNLAFILGREACVADDRVVLHEA